MVAICTYLKSSVRLSEVLTQYCPIIYRQSIRTTKYRRILSACLIFRNAVNSSVLTECIVNHTGIPLFHQFAVNPSVLPSVHLSARRTWRFTKRYTTFRSSKRFSSLSLHARQRRLAFKSYIPYSSKFQGRTRQE